MTHPRIRNIKSVTTGDFVDFEVLHDGAWRDAKISGTAIRELGTNGQTDLQVVEANSDRIAEAAQRLASTTPLPAKIAVNSPDL